MEGSPIQLYAYVRISPTDFRIDRAALTDEQYKEEKDREAQHQMQLQKSNIEGFVKNRWPEQHVQLSWFTDVLKSGTKKENRPDFNRMMDEAVTNKPFAVIATKVDRYARSVLDLLISAKALEENKVNMIFTLQSVDTSNAYGKAFFQMLG